MALTEPSPVTWTIRFKYGKKTIMLHVDPLSPFTEVKTELLRALRLTHPDGSLAHSSPIPDAPEDVTLARPVDATDYTLGWTRIRSDDADQDSDEDVALEDLQADEGNKKPKAGKSKSKRRDFVDTTPKAAGLHDGCELAFRFRSNEKPGEDGRWNVAQLTYDDVVAPQADEDEGMVPDLEVQK